jgi:hypothetical protein
MKKYLFVLACITIVCASCSHSKKIATINPASPAVEIVDGPALPDAQQDASSYEKAVVIKEKTEMKGNS